MKEFEGWRERIRGVPCKKWGQRDKNRWRDETNGGVKNGVKKSVKTSMKKSVKKV